MSDYSHLMGWTEPKFKEQIAMLSAMPIPALSDVYSTLKDSGRGKTMILSDFVKVVHGSHIAQIQVIGDCVSFGSAHAADHVTCAEIVMKLEPELWMGITSTEDIYGGSRVLIGRGQLGYGDGSIGSWAARYVSEYGTLIRKQYEKDNLSVYSGERARKWGNPGVGTPQYLLPIARENKIRTVTLVRSYEEARDSIYNGYAVTVASNVGFTSRRDKDGFLMRSGSWAHQMCFIGMDDSFKRPGLLCLNSWPYNWVSGPTRFDMPPGSFWVDADTANIMLRQNDSFAYSDREGFEIKELKLDWV